MLLKTPLVFNTTFSTYTSSEIIGEGGSSRIYRALDENGNTVAIKVLKPTNSREKRKRFKNEVTFCINNRHKNIVPIIDHGVIISGDDTQPFYVMPLYDGSLRNLVKDGIPPEQVLPLFSQILDGIEAAHLQKVVHRDIKPENILWSASANLLAIADFGIAWFQEEELFTAVETDDSSRLAKLPVRST